ncbi:MAG: CoA pyrophosphatase [Acidimicrobiales bacterium]|nr:CoA pyrophosphatase [Acidimicrobiales bacterium]
MDRSPPSADETNLANNTTPASKRGGPQVIPRPGRVGKGAPAPWHELTSAQRDLSIAAIRSAFERLGPAVRSPRESVVSRASAVLAALYEDAGETYVILTRRSAALRVHSGEVSFPGGRQEPGEDLMDTAKREAWEEIGLDPSGVEIIGELDHLSTITSSSFIVPYVAVLDGRPHLSQNPSEVDAILHVPLQELADPTVFREERWDVFGTQRPIIFFELIGDTVWGATAAMLRQFLGLSTGTLGRGDLGHD